MPNSSSTPRRSQRERTADSGRRLMSAAMELILEKGFTATTAAEIGERAGFSRNMVRDRYGSKEGLLETLCREEFSERLLPAQRLNRNGTGLSLMLDQLGDLLGAAETSPQSLRAIIVIAFETPGTMPSLRAWWAEMIARYEAELAAHLTAGQQDGSVRRDIIPRIEAETYVSYGAGLCFRWALQPEEFDFCSAVRIWRDRLHHTYALD